ncbi:hypothetical protein SAMN05443247_06583 [Bradyrhizobium erythrophlei]|nr:hypothetical protein SAMN05443247_06583 [Bradyrhizobium erythrophlei]
MEALRGCAAGINSSRNPKLKKGLHMKKHSKYLNRAPAALQYLSTSFGRGIFTIADIRTAFRTRYADWIVKHEQIKRWITKVGRNQYKLLKRYAA